MIDYKLTEYPDNWIISESEFNKNNLAKFETIFSQGNGRIGLRASLEEKYVNETRNMFVAGTFNKAESNEVTELPNAIDFTEFVFLIDGVPFTLLEGDIKNYERSINLKTGELIRNVRWISKTNVELEFEFRRFVSMNNLYLIGHQVTIKLISDSNIKLSIHTGINGRLNNSGSQHFIEGNKRLYENEVLQYSATTNQSGIYFVSNTMCHMYKNSQHVINNRTLKLDRRIGLFQYKVELQKNDEVCLEKISNIYTSIDKEVEGMTNEEIDLHSLNQLKKDGKESYQFLFNESKDAWEKIWTESDIKIDSSEKFDQLAIRFTQYHLNIMTPKHDNRMNIGAKGLTGEGYKGHTFWDSDIFILPYWIYTNPEVAKSLVEYRFLSLKGAREKAKQNNCSGAMFPWESAWLEDGEVTPLYGGTNIITGEPEKIWTGLIEIHITADVAYGIWNYFNVTGDNKFMEDKGYQVIFETAKFWTSRLEWKEDQNRYEICDVIGPDEYKEHVNNNYYTNYMAKWNIELAMKYYNDLKDNNKETLKKLNQLINIEEIYKECHHVVDKIYLAKPNEDKVIPQDDMYLHLRKIDLSKYKNQENVGSISGDYNMEQISQIQVSKQADIMVLFLNFVDLYEQEDKKVNYVYYEDKCLHDSSLSLSTYSIMAKEIGDFDRSYELFKKCCRIDLGENMKSSDTGIHSASLGGIWQSIVHGFCGIRYDGNNLRIDPVLPKKWEGIKFNFFYRGCKLNIDINHNEIIVRKINGNNTVNLVIKNKLYQLDKTLQVNA